MLIATFVVFIGVMLAWCIHDDRQDHMRRRLAQQREAEARFFEDTLIWKALDAPAMLRSSARPLTWDSPRTPAALRSQTRAGG
jgi:hypothetical protein